MDGQAPSEAQTGQTMLSAVCRELLSEGLRHPIGVVAEELDDPGHIPDHRCCFVIFPVGHGKFIDPKLHRDVLLSEPELEPALLQVVAQDPKLRRVGRRFRRRKDDLAKWQKGRASPGTAASARAGACPWP